MKKCKKITLAFTLLLFSFFTFLPCVWINDAMAAPERIRLSMGGAGTGTFIYMFCALLSETWKNNIPGLDITLLATAGSTANYVPMSKGELDLAAAAVSGDYYAMNGLYFTKEKLSNFCPMLPATMGFNQVFTFADSPIKTYADLEGKRLAIGARGSPASVNSERYCKILGVKPKIVYSTISEAIDMMKDRRVDAIMYGVGAPWSGIMDVATAHKVRFLSQTPEQQKKITNALPFSSPGVIPVGTYSFQTEDYHTTMSLQTVNVRPGLSDDLVYKLCKISWDNWDKIIKAAPAARWVKPAHMLNMLAPIHPGAVKYYRDIGVQIPESMVWKKKN